MVAKLKLPTIMVAAIPACTARPMSSAHRRVGFHSTSAANSSSQARVSQVKAKLRLGQLSYAQLWPGQLSAAQARAGRSP